MAKLDLLLVESDNNLSIPTGTFDLQLTPTRSEYIAQKLRIKLSMFQGEWFLNVNDGLPFRESIFIKNPDLSFIEDLVKIEINSVDGVVEITEFSLELDSTRNMLITFTVRIEDDSLLTVTV